MFYVSPRSKQILNLIVEGGFCWYGEVWVGSLAEDMDQLAAATGTPGTAAGPWRLAW